MLRSVHRSAYFAARVSVLNRGQTGVRQGSGSSGTPGADAGDLLLLAGGQGGMHPFDSSGCQTWASGGELYCAPEHAHMQSDFNISRRVLHHVSHPPHSAHTAGGGPQVRSLFSASLSEAVEGLARSMMHAPLRVTVGDRGAAAPSVHQSLLFVGRCARPSWRARPFWLARPSWLAHAAFADNARAIILSIKLFFHPTPPSTTPTTPR